MLDDVAEIDLRVWEVLPQISELFLERGWRFTDYVGNDPLCCPGRAAFLTGQRTLDHGIFQNFARNFDPRTTIATELRKSGYHTIYSGKYFNETEAIGDKSPAGWDHSLIFSGSYFRTPFWVDGQKRYAGGDDEDYTTDVLTRQALRWLRQAPEEQPLLLMLTPFAAHSGLDADGLSLGYWQPVPAPRHRGDRRCADIRHWSPPSYNEPDVSDKPAYIRGLLGAPFPGGWPLTLTCESLLSVDEMLGEVRAELARQGRTDVLFLLTADNGMGWGMNRWTDKRVPYAIPLPLFISWEERLGTEPLRVRTTVTNMDLAPTLCELAGCEMGPFRNGKPVSGISVVPVLEDPAAPIGRTYTIHEHHTDRGQPRWLAVRTTRESPLGRWLYVRYETGETELYDLEEDPWLLENRSGEPAVRDVEQKLEKLIDGPFRM